ncbi:MAG: translocation/assembly module TamB [Bacteroidetes bacterium]|nr:translocation/assembly module TamB [Bacteroidota bacterium]
MFLVVLVIVPATILSFAWDPLVQTVTARMAAAYLSETLETNITIDRLLITPLFDISLKNVFIQDNREDTLLFTRKMFINLGNPELKNKVINVNSVSLKNAGIHLVKYEGDSSYNFSVIFSRLSGKQTDSVKIDSLKGEQWEVKLKGLDLIDVRFKMDNWNRPVKDAGMDYSHLDTYLAAFVVHDLYLNGDTVSFITDELMCHEQCGLEVLSMSGRLALSPAFLKAHSLLLKTGNSDLDLDFEFHYDDWNAYNDFINSVRIQAEIRPSVFNLTDIGCFATSLTAMDNPLRIGGVISGTVSNLKTNGFKFAFGKNTHFNGNVNMHGLPDVENTFMHLKAEEMQVSLPDLEAFNLPEGAGRIIIPEVIKTIGIARIKGSFTGFYNDFVSYASYRTAIGNVSTDLIVKQDSVVSVKYNGRITAESFDVGQLIGAEEYLGKVTLAALVDGQGLDAENLLIRLNGMINSLDLLDNSFNQIEVQGTFAEKRFNGEMNVSDELIQMKFKGDLDLGQDIPTFDFLAKINNARLYDLHLSERSQDMSISTTLRCNFIATDFDDLEGKIYIDSTSYTEKGINYYLDHLALVTLRDTGMTKRIFLHSDFMEASIKGDFLFNDMGQAFVKLFDRYVEAGLVGLELEKTSLNQQFLNFDISLYNTDNLTQLFVPDLKVHTGTNLTGTYTGDSDFLEFDMTSPEISWKGIRFKGLDIHAQTLPRHFAIGLSSYQTIFQESEENDSLEFGMENFGINANIRRDSILFKITWDDHSILDKNKADISGYYAILDTAYSTASIDTAHLVINDSSWMIRPGNLITMDSTAIKISNLEFVGGKQQLKLNGAVSGSPADTLNADFRDWQMSNFDILLKDKGFDLDAVINGNLSVSNVFNSISLYSDISLTGFRMNTVLLGDAVVQSHWDPDQHRAFVNAEIIYTGNVGSSKVLDLEGYYYPNDPDRNFDFSFYLQNFHLKALRPFVSGILDNLDGIASANFELDGTESDPILSGTLKLMRTTFKVDYLNTRYELAHEIKFDRNGLYFKDLVVYDTLGNQAVCDGSLTHDKLEDFRLDVELRPQNFICLNTDRYQNSDFYGSALATGSVDITGELDDLTIDVDARTNAGTFISIPLNTRASLMQNDYIVFINPGNLTDEVEVLTRNVNVKGLSLNLKLDVTNDAELLIYLPDQMGNLSARGAGQAQLSISPSGEFRLVGDYIISRGTFLFTIQNLIRKRFEILSGGKIQFTGDPLDATLNVKGLYKVKTNITGLSPTLDELYAGEKINVDCILWLQDRLMNPDIRFNLRFPNVKDEIRQDIYALIDTNDQAVMNQQMISLLMLNSFSYTSGGNFGASSFNIIGNQLSNWLSQISRDFDVGINYRAGDELSEDELQVALSTQLFDDRLIIDGNIGVSSKSNSQNASNIVGDVNIEYKLRKDGRVRLKAFNRSNNINTLDDIAPYTQGVGIFYRKEFNNFGDLFKRERKKSRKP